MKPLLNLLIDNGLVSILAHYRLTTESFNDNSTYLAKPQFLRRNKIKQECTPRPRFTAHGNSPKHLSALSLPNGQQTPTFFFFFEEEEEGPGLNAELWFAGN